MPTLEAQIVNTRVTVTSDDAHVLRRLGIYLNSARHDFTATEGITLSISREDGAYALSTGRRELTAPHAAEAAWRAVERELRTVLAGWLQILGTVIDGHGKRLLIIGDDGVPLSLALHALAGGLDVPSANGICFGHGKAVPFACPLDLMPEELRRFSKTTGLLTGLAGYHDTMGDLRFSVRPADLGRPWVAHAREIDSLLLLRVNPGGWSGIRRGEPGWLFDRLLHAAYIPATAAPRDKLAMVTQAKVLAATVPAAELRLGRIADAPALLREHLFN